MIETDKWDNRWLSKERSINKIDPAVALCMAIVRTRALSAQLLCTRSAGSDFYRENHVQVQ